jgi:hypothetical protein
MTVRAVLTPLGEDLFGLHFDLINDGPEPIEIPAYEPFLAFSVLAAAGSTPVPVRQPALDLGLQATTIHLAPHAGTTLETPIRLHIAAGAEAGTDGFVWTVAHPLAGLSLRIDLALPAPFAGEYELSPLRSGIDRRRRSA